MGSGGRLALDGRTATWGAGRDGGAAAGVPVTTVRYDGITHDFMMLNPLSGTHATRAAVAQATAFLRKALHGA